jgi:hypothetical protein
MNAPDIHRYGVGVLHPGVVVTILVVIIVIDVRIGHGCVRGKRIKVKLQEEA